MCIRDSDTADASNRLALQLVLGTGTVSRITVEEIVDTAAWQHVSDAEKAEGHAVYDAENDTITFPNRTSAWAARMVYTLSLIHI